MIGERVVIRLPKCHFGRMIFSHHVLLFFCDVRVIIMLFIYRFLVRIRTFVMQNN